MLAFILFFIFIFICYIFFSSVKQKQQEKTKKREKELLKELEQTYSQPNNKFINNSKVLKSNLNLDNKFNTNNTNLKQPSSQISQNNHNQVLNIITGQDLKSQMVNIQIQTIKIQNNLQNLKHKHELSKIISLMDNFIKNHIE